MTAYWREQAACTDTDPELWFPPTGGSTARARAICGDCEARNDCLEWALRHRVTDGIWGGLSPEQRLRIMKVQRRASTALTDDEEADREAAHAEGLSDREAGAKCGIGADRYRKWRTSRALPANFTPGNRRVAS